LARNMKLAQTASIVTSTSLGLQFLIFSNLSVQTLKPSEILLWQTQIARVDSLRIRT